MNDTVKLLLKLVALSVGILFLTVGVYTMATGVNPLGGTAHGWVLVLASGWFILPPLIQWMRNLQRVRELPPKSPHEPLRTRQTTLSRRRLFWMVSLSFWIAVSVGLGLAYSIWGWR